MRRAFFAGLAVLLSAVSGRADLFDEHTGEVISKGRESDAVARAPKITAKQLAVVPRAVPGSQAAMMLCRTVDNNWCKLLIRTARVKKKDGNQVDFILIERLVTYHADLRRGIVADKSGIYLFGGFELDLDLGQVVPAGHGADLKVVADDKNVTLEPINDSELYLVGRPMFEADKPAPKKKFSQGAVEPADFAGVYKLDADGRWGGEVTIKVDGDIVTGVYKSDKSGESYDIVGKIGPQAHRIEFKVTFPMTEQKYEGFLWTHDRDRITGVTQMLDQPFGFQAVRKE